MQNPTCFILNVLDFGKPDINLKKLNCPAPEIPQVANDWLQNKLTESDDSCADWLWLHDRWKTVNHPTQRFQLNNHRKMQISNDRAIGGYRLWIRMPNWLGDVVMALPLIKALRNSRPDAEITLISQSAYIPLLKLLDIGDNRISIPEKRTTGYFKYFKKLRNLYPDTHLMFTNSYRGDLESKYIGAPQRFGLVLPGQPRPLLTHKFLPPPDIINQMDQIHQTKLWEKMLQHFGLRNEIDDTPFSLQGMHRQSGKIGFITGSSNNPDKRWPPAQWIALGKQILEDLPNRKSTSWNCSRPPFYISDRRSPASEAHSRPRWTDRFSNLPANLQLVHSSWVTTLAGFILRTRSEHQYMFVLQAN